MKTSAIELCHFSVLDRRLAHALALALFIVTWFSSGCAQIPSYKAYANDVVRHRLTIDDMKKAACNNPDIKCHDWKKPDYLRENGNSVYREMSSPRCWYHWEVDKTGHIVRWRVESDSVEHRGACDYLPPPDERFSPWYGSE